MAAHVPQSLSAPQLTHAAVAMVLRGSTDLEILFIERARHAADPWSGDLGLPGGKVESGDADPRQTAERETLEEVGLNLTQERYLGRLDDIIGAHLPVKISCFVYHACGDRTLQLSEEVGDAFWVKLAELQDPSRHGEAEVLFGGEPFIRQAVRLARADKPVLWGITYRLVMQFFELLAGRGDADD